MDDIPIGTFIIRSVSTPVLDEQEPVSEEPTEGIDQNVFRINTIKRGRPHTPRIRMRAPFAVEGQTIPTKCPRCHTEKQITRKHERHWLCKVCDFEWRS